eukprot:7447126-Alexandrium_andersonii.AAC.1
MAKRARAYLDGRSSAWAFAEERRAAQRACRAQTGREGTHAFLSPRQAGDAFLFLRGPRSEVR